MTPANNWWWLVLLLVTAATLTPTVDGAVASGGKLYDDPAFCEGRVSAYFVSDNVNINSSASFVMRNTSESRCLDLCSANRDSKGRWVFCASVIYDRDRDICAIHRRGSVPDGSANREPESGKRYFEKFCLAEDLPLDCADRQFVRVDQFILKGYAQTTATLPTMAECAAHCVREKKFQCKSAMYFHEEGECITNTESAITRPDDFMRPDDDDKVVFFHNGCLGSRLATDTNNRGGEETPTTVLAPASSTTNATDAPPPNQTKRFSSPAPSSSSRAHKTLPIGKNVRKAEPRHQRTQQKQSSIQIEESTDATEPIEELSTPASTATPTTVADPTTTAASSTAKSRHNLVRRTKAASGKATSPIPDSTTAATTATTTTPPSSAVVTNEPKIDAKRTSSERTFKVSKEDVSRSEEIDPAKFRTPKRTIETPKRLYGAKAIERAEDGSLRESPLEEESKLTTTASAQQNHEVAIEPPPHHSHTSYVDTHKPKAPKVHKSLSEAGTGEPTSATAKRLQFKSIKHAPSEPAAAATTTPTAPLHLERRDVVVKSNSPSQSATLNTAGGGGGGAFDEEGESGFFSHWGPWTPCTEPGERRVRRRRCLDLRRCKGALMQVDYCPQDVKPALATIPAEEGPTRPTPVRSPLPINAPETVGVDKTGGSPPSILPPKLPERELKPLPVGAPGGPTDVWSPWQGACQRFASPQPCTRHEMIGFESRECIAKDPAACKGPFFRYCTIKC